MASSFGEKKKKKKTMATRVRANKYVGLVLKEEPVHDLVGLCSLQPKA